MSWEVAYPIGALVLLGVLMYGYIRNKTRNKANDKITEAATKELYEHPDRYEHGGREAFKAQLKD